MNLHDFKKQLPKIKNLPLPGHDAHAKMVPATRTRDLANLNVPKTAKKAGVMALIYPEHTDEATLLLILRKTYRGVHANQIAFPGGKVEPLDTNLQETALRETHEEVGVHPAGIKVVRSLSQVYIPPSNFLVAPFIGYCEVRPSFVKQESEVEDLVKVPFSQLLMESNVQTRIITTSYAKKMEVPIFYLGGHVVWGATAMMLSELKEMWLKTR